MPGFDWALRQMLDKHKSVDRAAWEGVNRRRLIIMSGVHIPEESDHGILRGYRAQIFERSDVYLGPWTPLHADILADDWEGVTIADI